MPAVDDQDLSLDLRVMDSLSPNERAQWNQWAALDPDQGSPFFRVEYALLAAPVCPGAGLAVFRRGEEVVGYFPFQRRGGTIQPLGAPMNDYHGIIGPIGRRPSLEQAAALMKAKSFAVTAWIGEAETLAYAPSYRARLQPGHDYAEWYAERRSAFPKYFKDKERAKRSFEVEFGSFEVAVGLTEPGLLHELVKLKSEQYRRSGLHDIFACGWTLALLEALMASPYEDFGGQICILRASGRAYALEYSLRGGSVYHFWFPAYYPEAGRTSPGILLSMETIRQMSERGCRQFDYGTGSGGYKRYFCDREQPVGEARITAPGLASLGLAAGRRVLDLGAERGQRLQDRIRRRWSVIEACEVTLSGRAGGIMAAAKTAMKKQD